VISDPDPEFNPFLTLGSSSGRPVFLLKFRAEPRVDGVRALRALLKTSLRRFGLRCISATEDR
jgi:hypothetical protein